MARDLARPNRGLRLAELLAAVSLASDLAHDVPAESALGDNSHLVEVGRALADFVDLNSTHTRAPSARLAHLG